MSSASVALVINCGSSSLKITFKDAAENKTTVSRAESGHNCALKTLFAWLADLALLARLCAPGHRVAHGGNDFKQSVLLASALRGAA